jgi:hypothetical protein
MTIAQTFLTDAASLMDERAKEYDQPGGERSMGKTVDIFNIYTGKNLKESDGWLFMQILKDVRQWSTPKFHVDSVKDCIAYAALKAESLEKESLEKVIESSLVAPSSSEVAELKAEISDLLTVMIAAAEEISEHWEAHCDEDGYGPTNLMYRLERGIPSKYGYTAGDFAKLQNRVEELEEEKLDLVVKMQDALRVIELVRQSAINN